MGAKGLTFRQSSQLSRRSDNSLKDASVLVSPFSVKRLLRILFVHVPVCLRTCLVPVLFSPSSSSLQLVAVDVVDAAL